MTSGTAPTTAAKPAKPAKLHGRAFYESIGSPKYIVAPMVDQSEFAWRMLTRSFLPEAERGNVLAYSPMLHARLFAETNKYRDSHFQPTTTSMLPSDSRHDGNKSSTGDASAPAPYYLDGNPTLDRPLIVQFCANDPSSLLDGARRVAPYCDAVDLNLGCPQGIARKGHYGAFLQEDQALVHSLVRTLHEELPVPVTAKIRILDTREATLAYARNVLDAGASILTVHGRRREQKGHMTGVADWAYIRFLRENLPRETVIFANGNVLQHGDLQRCLDATGADGVMSAEGNLSDPAIFAAPPAVGTEGREYWRGKDGRGGWRVDAIVRRYLDIMHRYVVGQDPPERRPLFVPGDDEDWLRAAAAAEEEHNNNNKTTNDESSEAQEPARKKRRKDGGKDNAGGGGGGGGGGGKKRMSSVTAGANFIAMQPHLFHLLRHFITRHHDVRDALAQSKLGDISVHERVLDMVERRVAEGLLEYERTGAWGGDNRARNGAYDKGSRGEQAQAPESKSGENGGIAPKETEDAAGQQQHTVIEEGEEDDPDSSAGTIRRCKRPWWVAQPIIRPLPKEAMAKGAVSLSKKELQKQKLAGEQDSNKARADEDVTAEGEIHRPTVQANGTGTKTEQAAEVLEKTTSFPDSGLVSG